MKIESNQSYHAKPSSAIANNNLNVASQLAQLHVPMHLPSQKCDLSDVRLVNAAVKIQRCFRAYRDLRTSLLPQPKVCTPQVAREKLIQILEQNRGQHYWGNHQLMDVNIAPGLKYSLPFSTYDHVCAQGVLFKQPYTNTHFDKEMSVKAFVHDWPAAERLTVERSLEKSMRTFAAQNGHDFSDMPNEFIDLPFPLEILNEAGDKTIAKVAPNTLSAFMVSPKSLEITFLKRLKSNDLNLNCLQFVHFTLFQAGIITLAQLKEVAQGFGELKKMKGTPINASQLQKGDLILIYRDANKFSHIGFYNGRKANKIQVFGIGLNAQTPHAEDLCVDVKDGRVYLSMGLEDVIRAYQHAA